MAADFRAARTTGGMEPGKGATPLSGRWEDSDAEPALHGDDQGGIDRGRCRDGPRGRAGQAEERDADGTLGRVMAQAIADAGKAGVSERLRPLLGPGVVLAGVDRGGDAEGASSPSGAVGQLYWAFHVEGRDSAPGNVGILNERRVPKDFDEGSDRLLGEIAGAARRGEVEAAGLVVREPPGPAIVAVDADERTVW
jgi:hypothetical protein